MKLKSSILLILIMNITNMVAMKHDAKIYVAGHTGLVGSAVVDELKKQGYTNLLLRTSKELDLCDQQATDDFFAQELPEYVFVCAAKVGGIKANATYPVDFIYDNLMIATNVIHAAYKYGVKKLLFLGSSCIYPRLCPQPIKEEYLLTSPLEKTNEPYAIAKIAAINLCQSLNKQYDTCFISCMPTNLYGPRDNFDLETSHVLPALIAKMDKAKEDEASYIELWGTGSPRREFLYVEDLAEALVFLMNNYNDSLHINVGVGQDISVKELAYMIKEIVGYKGEIRFNNNTYYDGTPQKLLCVDRLHKLGWQAKTGLKEGIEKTYEWYEAQKYIKKNQRSNSVQVLG